MNQISQTLCMCVSTCVHVNMHALTPRSRYQFQFVKSLNRLSTSEVRQGLKKTFLNTLAVINMPPTEGNRSLQKPVNLSCGVQTEYQESQGVTPLPGTLSSPQGCGGHNNPLQHVNMSQLLPVSRNQYRPQSQPYYLI